LKKKKQFEIPPESNQNPPSLSEVEQIEEWKQQLAKLKEEIKNLEENLEKVYVGHEHRARRRTAREQLSQFKLNKEKLKDQIEAAKALLHIQNFQTKHNNLVAEREKNISETPSEEKFIGKYTFLNTDDGNLLQHHLCLNSGKTCTLHLSLNNSKNYDQKSGYTFDYSGKYFIETEEGNFFI